MAHLAAYTHCWRMRHRWTRGLMSSLMSGQKTSYLALALHLLMPRCPVWIPSRILVLMLWGMTTLVPLKRIPPTTVNSSSKALYRPWTGHWSSRLSMTCARVSSLVIWAISCSRVFGLIILYCSPTACCSASDFECSSLVLGNALERASKLDPFHGQTYS